MLFWRLCSIEIESYFQPCGAQTRWCHPAGRVEGLRKRRLEPLCLRSSTGIQRPTSRTSQMEDVYFNYLELHYCKQLKLYILSFSSSSSSIPSVHQVLPATSMFFRSRIKYGERIGFYERL